MTEQDSFAKYRLRKSLDTLRNKRSEDGSTCLVTLYIPEDRAIADFTNELTNEIGTAANIKSKTTRKNVQSALQITIGKLRLIGPKAPKNGVALFVGVTEGGKMESFVLNPNTPITRKQYICDSYFHIDHLEEHLLEKKLYGLITVDAGYSTIGLLQGNHLTVLKSIQSSVPKKHSRGGQSAPRFGRIRQNSIDEFLKRASDYAKNLFIEDANRQKQIAGIIVGGPGLLKYRLVEDGYLDGRIMEKLIKPILEIGMVSDKEGMNELVEKAQPILQGTRFIEEREIIQKWLDLVYKDDERAVYGEEELRKYLTLGAVDLLIGSESLNMSRVTYTCANQPESHEQIAINLPTLEVETNNIPQKLCSTCNSSMTVTDTKDLLEDLGELALQTGTKVEVVSAETEEGQQLLHFTGIAGILRYIPA